MGWRVLQWPALLSLLFRDYTEPTQQVWFIHLRGDDLGLVKDKAIVLQACVDFGTILQHWPRVCLTWSAITSRLAWHNTICPKAMERVRKCANWEIRLTLEGGFRMYLPNPEITVDQSELYQQNGVHLSDIFLSTIQQGLVKALGFSVGART